MSERSNAISNFAAHWTLRDIKRERRRRILNFTKYFSSYEQASSLQNKTMAYILYTVVFFVGVTFDFSVITWPFRMKLSGNGCLFVCVPMTQSRPYKYARQKK